MKKSLYKKNPVLLMLVMFICFHQQALSLSILTQDDTVKVYEAPAIPVIDAIADDGFWEFTDWQTIDQVWIPLNADLTADDFTGKFKVLWSSDENLLYFLVETTDDVFVDGYNYPDTDYPNYDIVEIFFDENRSGGEHVFDSGSENAENAFSYHIVPDQQPTDGGVVTDFVVCDIDGTSWGDRTVPNYADHFPEFAVTRSGNTYTWEFSMKVYDDTYDASSPEESRVSLTEGKLMGATMAYCDNDAPGTDRDHFFGSVEPNMDKLDGNGNYNDQWKNADDYGVFELAGLLNITPDFISSADNNLSIAIFPNPTKGKINYSISNNLYGALEIDVLNIIGKKVFSYKIQKNSKYLSENIDLTSLQSGVYLLVSKIGNTTDTRKLIIK